MLSTLLRSVLRNSKNNLLTTLISLFGLTIGLAVSLILFAFILEETSFDKHHESADRTYQLITQFIDNNGNEGTFGITTGIIAEDFINNFPEVERTVRTFGPMNTEADFNDFRYNDVKVVYADFSFFSTFDFPGFRKGTFSANEHAIISNPFASRLGADLTPGDGISVFDQDFFIQTIVDVPQNTRFDFDLILPITSFSDFEDWKHGGLEFGTYVVLRENSQKTLDKLSNYYNSTIEKKWDDYVGRSFFLPLADVYLNDRVSTNFGNGSWKMVYTLSSIATLVMLLAIINYLNLSIANGHSRKNEIRIKKIMGATKKHITLQTSLESTIYLIFSGFFALIIFEVFNELQAQDFFGRKLITFLEWSPISLLLYLLSLFLLGIIIGLYPAYDFFKKGTTVSQQEKPTGFSLPTRVLIIFQFTVAACLLSGILFINLQLDFLKRISPGYQSENVVLIKNLNEQHKEQYDIIRNELATLSAIKNVSGMQAEPGAGASGQLIVRDGFPDESRISIAHVRTIEGYAETFGLEFVSGRDFQLPLAENEHQFILNETARDLLFTSDEFPIGQKLVMGHRKGSVVGIVKDYHFRSFHHQIDPLVLNVEEPYFLNLAIKISTDDIKGTLQSIGDILMNVDPLYSLDYIFMDQKFDQLYRSELLSRRIVSYSSIIALAISILGIFAMSIFIINTKTKEIAIRKVLGAARINILWELSYKLIFLIFIGNLLSIPISFLVLTKWSESFVYQIASFHLFWIAPACMLLAMIAAGATVFMKLRKTMLLNPVIFLRNE